MKELMKSTKYVPLAVLVTFVLVAAVFFGTITGLRYSQTRTTMAYLLAQPRFASTNLLKQITDADAKLVLLDDDSQTMYFSVPKKHDPIKEALKMCNNPRNIRVGERIGDRIQLDDTTYGGPLLANQNLVAFPVRNFEFDIYAPIKVPYRYVTYTVTPLELNEFTLNRTIIGGPLWIITGDVAPGVKNGIVNFGSFVAKRREQSLRRLCHAIVSGEKSKPVIAQKLLDFVTKEIAYDMSETDWSGQIQVIKKADETLLTRTGTCAAKTVLYASMLEQYWFDYLIAYYDRHVNILLADDFPGASRPYVMIDGRKYQMVETTARGFVIGKSQIPWPAEREILYTVKPGQEAVRYRPNTI